MIRKLKEIIATVLELTEDITDSIDEDTDLCEYGLDSMTCVEMVVNLEDEFDITIDEEDLLVENMSSIAQLCELIRKYQE